MGAHNICLYKEADKKYTGCNLKTMELPDCVLIGICVVIKSNTVYVMVTHLKHLTKAMSTNNIIMFFVKNHFLDTPFYAPYLSYSKIRKRALNYPIMCLKSTGRKTNCI